MPLRRELVTGGKRARPIRIASGTHGVKRALGPGMAWRGPPAGRITTFSPSSVSRLDTVIASWRLNAGFTATPPAAGCALPRPLSAAFTFSTLVSVTKSSCCCAPPLVLAAAPALDRCHLDREARVAERLGERVGVLLLLEGAELDPVVPGGRLGRGPRAGDRAGRLGASALATTRVGAAGLSAVFAGAVSAAFVGGRSVAVLAGAFVRRLAFRRGLVGAFSGVGLAGRLGRGRRDRLLGDGLRRRAARSAGGAGLTSGRRGDSAPAGAGAGATAGGGGAPGAGLSGSAGFATRAGGEGSNQLRR